MTAQRKPLIGVCTAGMEEIVKQKQIPYSNLEDKYLTAIIRAGGIPLVLPQVRPEDTAAQIDALDGLLLAGGADINPLLFGEEPIPKQGAFYPDRDDHEIAAVKAAYDRDIPLLAICRGIQLLNVALGGTLWQDFPSQIENPIKHWQNCPNNTGSHSVKFTSGSRLHRLFGDRYVVNSFHHQAIKQEAEDLIVTARDPEGLIEGVESKTKSFVLGVQWHPEHMVLDHEPMDGLFRDLVEASAAED